MKALLLQYAQYNHWANKRIADLAINLTDAQLQKETPSSFKTITGTLLHLWDAEAGWYNRLALKGDQPRPGKTFHGSILELTGGLLAQSAQWIDLIDQITADQLQADLSYTSSANEIISRPVYQVVHHLFNHQSFHRGQIITLMHNAGVAAFPATDFITFAGKH